MKSEKKKSRGVKFGEWGGHVIGPHDELDNLGLGRVSETVPRFAGSETGDLCLTVEWRNFEAYPDTQLSLIHI